MEFESSTLFGALLKDDHKETLQLIQKTAAYLGSTPNSTDNSHALQPVFCQLFLCTNSSRFGLNESPYRQSPRYKGISHSTQIKLKKEQLHLKPATCFPSKERDGTIFQCELS